MTRPIPPKPVAVSEAAKADDAAVVGTPMQEPPAAPEAATEAAKADDAAETAKGKKAAKADAPKEGKGQKYVNPGNGLVDIKGAKFIPNTPRALTDEEADNANITKRIDHAVVTGLLQKA